MLKEIIDYNINIPVKAFINGITNYPLHWHDSIEIICVLDGSIRIKDSCFSYCLTKGDVYIFNCEDLHSIHSISKTNIILFIYIDLDYFKKYFKNIEQITFICDSYIKKRKIESNLKHLRYLLSKIFMEYNLKQIKNNNIEIYTKSLLSFLIDNFQYFSYEKNELNSIDFKNKGNCKLEKNQLSRMHRISDYIYEHYNEKITLNDIAKLEYLNTYYISHFIKKACGLTFQELVSLARVEASEKLLIDTDKTIDLIASETGFSSRKHLNIQFKKWYKLTPLQFRKKYKNKNNFYKENIKYLGYNNEKALDIITSYLYGNNDIHNNIPKNNDLINYIKLFILSGEIFRLFDNIDSQEDILKLFNQESNIFIQDYSSFIQNIDLILRKENINDEILNEILQIKKNLNADISI